MQPHDHVDIRSVLCPADDVPQPLAHRRKCDVPTLNGTVPDHVEEHRHQRMPVAETEVAADPIVVGDAIRPEVVEGSPTADALLEIRVELVPLLRGQRCRESLLPCLLAEIKDAGTG